MSAASELPFELLSEIFDLAYDGDYDIVNVGFVNVCSYWRAVALASPHLWSCITVRKSREGLAAILKRSQSCPLTIRATLKDQPSYAVPLEKQPIATTASSRILKPGQVWQASPSLYEILKILFSHSHRWSDVSLRLSPNLFHFLNDFKGPLPILRKLHLEMIYTSCSPSKAHIVSFKAFTVAPQLTHLVIVNILCGVSFPASNLRSVHLTQFASLQMIYEVVRDAPCLTKLVASRSENPIKHDSMPHIGHSIVHNYLREIEIHRIHSVGWLFASFIFPNLESFTLEDFSKVEDHNTIPLLSHFFAASSPPLRELSIRGIMPNEFITPLLGAVPTVEELVISQTMLADERRADLRFGELVAKTLCANNGFLPHLRSLDLYASAYPHGVGHCRCTGDIFADMVASRWESSSQVVKLEHCAVTRSAVTVTAASLPMSAASIPFELLSKIFGLAYDDRDISNAGFAGVCSYWRAVALASPHLWNHVTVRKSGKGLAAILERSHPCPLTIRATIEDDPSYVVPVPAHAVHFHQPRMMAFGKASPSLYKILEILFSHSQRWSDVSLRLSPNLFHFLDDFPGPFPILQKMHLEMIYATDFLEDSPPVSSNCFAVAPQLTHLVIANIRHGILFPASNLHSVYLTQFATIEKIFEIISEAPYLTKIVATRAQNYIQDERIPRTQSPVVHNSLREIETHRIYQVGWLFASFIFPNLDSFMLEDFSEIEDRDTIRLLSDFFAASLPPLRKLSIRGIMPTLNIIRLLAAVPTVKELIISQTNHGHGSLPFGELLARTLCMYGGFLPHLRSLDLYVTFDPEDDVYHELIGSIFADMIALRWESSSQRVKLKHVRVGGYKHGFGSSVVERFESFKRQGLDISWVARDKSLEEETPLIE
ncbi:uncharacterized protein EV420DRAFT_1743345, partial [Desarmillaria tabescens]